MSKKLPLNDFKWTEKTSQFNEKFIIIYNEDGVLARGERERERERERESAFACNYDSTRG